MSQTLLLPPDIWSTRRELHHVITISNTPSDAGVDVEFCVWPFWASLGVGQLIREVGPRLQSAKDLKLGCQVPGVPFSMKTVWNAINSWNVGDVFITAVAVVMDKFLAVGFCKCGFVPTIFLSNETPIANGDIDLIHIAVFLTFEPSQVRSHAEKTLKGHRGKITCLFFSDELVSRDAKKVLVSSGEDCIIRVWNLETSACIGQFLAHNGGTTGFVPVPLEAGSRMKNAIMSIASDHSVSVISLEERAWYVVLIVTSGSKLKALHFTQFISFPFTCTPNPKCALEDK